MKNWFKSLLSETIFSIWWILSALSTLSTFFLQGFSGRWRTASAVSAIVGFAWANFRVFRKQEDRIAALDTELASHRERGSRLKITVDKGSRYILHPVGTVPHGDFNGIFLDLRLMVENAGSRNSTIDNYAVEIVELRQTFANLRPVEGQQGVQGRHCQHGLNYNSNLSDTGIIRVDAESTTRHGALFFSIPGVNLERFAAAGLSMHGEQRKFGTLRCRLTLTDTMGSPATEEFELHED